MTRTSYEEQLGLWGFDSLQLTSKWPLNPFSTWDRLFWIARVFVCLFCYFCFVLIYFGLKNTLLFYLFFYCPWRPEKDIESCGTGVTDDFELSSE